MQPICLVQGAWVIVLAIVTCALAPTTPAMAQAGTSTDRFDDLWSRAELYRGDSDSFLQSVRLSGRFQVDQAYLDTGDAEHSETNLRRMRLGIKMTFLDDLLLHFEADYDPQDGDPVYRRLTDAYLAWNPDDAIELKVGKHGAPFTLDGMTSSKELLAIDRSNLTNNIWFTTEYIPGVSIRGDIERFSYHAGVYSSGGAGRGLGDSDGGEFFLGTVRYDLAPRLAAQTARVGFNFVHNQPDENNEFTRPLEQILSLHFDLDKDSWGLRADLSAARGYFGQSDLAGFMLMPYLNVRGSNQLVLRYTHVESDEVNGVRFGRYESALGSGRGDEYGEVYLGVNHYWYGHKLKLQSGLQYSEMRDRAGDGGSHSGWSWVTGFRISW